MSDIFDFHGRIAMVTGASRGAMLFLASDARSYVTGQTLLVDGDMSTGATRASTAPQPAPLEERT